jgi:hypothetical protein
LHVPVFRRSVPIEKRWSTEKFGNRALNVRIQGTNNK